MRERELRCGSIPQQTAEDRRGVCDCTAEEEEEEGKAEHARRLCRATEECTAAVLGPHQVEVPVPSPADHRFMPCQQRQDPHHQRHGTSRQTPPQKQGFRSPVGAGAQREGGGEG